MKLAHTHTRHAQVFFLFVCLLLFPTVQVIVKLTINLITGLWKADVRINYCIICENRPIWEPSEFEKLKNLITWMDLTIPRKKIKNNNILFFLKNQSSFHNIMWGPKPSRSHKKVRTAQHPTLMMTFTWIISWWIMGMRMENLNCGILNIYDS